MTPSKLALVRGAGAPLLHEPQDTPDRVAAGWVSHLSPHTLRAFRCDLATFGAWLGVQSDEELLGHMKRVGKQRSTEIVKDFLRVEAERGLAPSTVAGRLTAIRSLLRVAEERGLLEWTVSVRLPRRSRAKVRDMRGPSRDEMERLIATTRASVADDPELGRRDCAVLALLYGAALRVEEACSLDLEHWTPRRELWVHGKGMATREPHPALAPWVADALGAWLEVRPPVEAPAFLLSFAVPRDKTERRRVTQGALRARLAVLAQRAGVQSPVRPHGLRHACATHARQLGASMADISRLLRHASVATTIDHYDDDTTGAMHAATLLTPGAP